MRPGALFCRIDRCRNLVTGSDWRHPTIAGRTAALLAKRMIRQAGLGAGEFSGHSLRAGMMTAADRKDVPLERAMEHGRWKSLATARGYRRHSSLWQGNFIEALLRDQ